ncbi:TM2 domain-containing protein [Coprothermobacter platensis]|uniref:TM2 domain-containing protein n=1 Tax=Coprothermobacter platensis TaxID=108819 RepID=UPI0003616ED9|nr:TM2 domain-containing protein [Coprothermobacter platensis]
MSVNRKQELTMEQLAVLESEMQKRRKSVGLAYVLCIFLGGLGIHKFYLQETTQGILYLLLGVFGFISMIAGEFSSLVSFGATGNGLFEAGLFCSIALGLLILIDLFTLPGQVRKATESIENKTIDEILHTANNPSTQ